MGFEKNAVKVSKGRLVACKALHGKCRSGASFSNLEVRFAAFDVRNNEVFVESMNRKSFFSKFSVVCPLKTTSLQFQ